MTGPAARSKALARLFTDPAIALAFLLLVAVAAGGGGVPAAFGNLTVQLAALTLLAIHGPRAMRPSVSWPRALAILAAGSMVLPLAQIVPLPPAAWQALPGRETVREALAIAGGTGWRPMSLDPARTLVAALGLVAPLAVLALGLRLPPRHLVTVQKAVIGIVIASAAFGALHLVNDAWGDLYADQIPLRGVLVGTLADRNGAGLLFVIALLFLIGLPTPPANGTGIALRAIGGAALALAAILTQSRSAIVLLGAPAMLLAWRLFAGRGGFSRWAAVAVAVAAISATGLVVSSGRVQSSLDRFDASDGRRSEMREDALHAAARYWPVGAGMGTFDEVFQLDESLEYLSPRKTGRAHMDYLELAIEAGLAGLVLLAGWIAWGLWATWLALRRAGAWPAQAAALSLFAIGAQSVISFPLRSQAMLCAAAFAIVLLARSPAAAPRDARP